MNIIRRKRLTATAGYDRLVTMPSEFLPLSMMRGCSPEIKLIDTLKTEYDELFIFPVEKSINILYWTRLSRHVIKYNRKRFFQRWSTDINMPQK